MSGNRVCSLATECARRQLSMIKGDRVCSQASEGAQEIIAEVKPHMIGAINTEAWVNLHGGAHALRLGQVEVTSHGFAQKYTGLGAK